MIVVVVCAVFCVLISLSNCFHQPYIQKSSTFSLFLQESSHINNDFGAVERPLLDRRDVNVLSKFVFAAVSISLIRSKEVHAAVSSA